MNTWSTTATRPSLQAILTSTHLGLTLLSVCVTTLVLTLLAVFALRSAVNRSLHVIAQSMSFNAQAAVVFQNRAAAYQAMASLAESNEEEIKDARLYDAQGNLLAKWHRQQRSAPLQSIANACVEWLMPAPFFQPIMHDGRKIGSIGITAYGGRMARFLVQGILWLLLGLSLTAACVFYFSRRLTRNIITPLRQFARVTHAIRDERAFDRRVPEAPISELDDLGRDFNALLAELDAWERKNRQERAQLTIRATRDDLTGLAKRGAFNEHLHRVVSHAVQQGGCAALLFIDVDHFKQVNDLLGHAAGDTILVGIAERLKAQLRDGDLAARLGGDEFAIVLQSLHGADDANRVAERVAASMEEPITLAHGRQYTVSISIGVAVLPDHADSVDRLMAAADAAMYSAKRNPARAWHVARDTTTLDDSGAGLNELGD